MGSLPLPGQREYFRLISTEASQPGPTVQGTVLAVLMAIPIRSRVYISYKVGAGVNIFPARAFLASPYYTG